MNKQKQKLLNQLNNELSNSISTNHDTANSIEHNAKKQYQTKQHKRQVQQRIIRARKFKKKIIRGLIIPKPSSQPTLEANIVLALILLNHKPQKYLLKPNLDDNALHAKYASNFSTLHILTSLGLANIVKHHHVSKGIKCKAVITSTGQQFVKQFIPQYQLVYQLSKKRRNTWLKKPKFYINYTSISYSFIFLIIINTIAFMFGTLGIEYDNSGIGIIIFLIILIPLIIILDINLNNNITSYKNNIIFYKAYSKQANKTNVLQFLRQHHLQEPNYQFNKDSSQIPLSQVIFKTVDEESQHYKQKR